jgi:hypothetical protein
MENEPEQKKREEKGNGPNGPVQPNKARVSRSPARKTETVPLYFSSPADTRDPPVSMVFFPAFTSSLETAGRITPLFNPLHCLH